MSHDKKFSAGKNRWVLPAGIGSAVVRKGIPEAAVRAAVQSVMEG
jgi:3-dehydroquinate synthetase